MIYVPPTPTMTHTCDSYLLIQRFSAPFLRELSRKLLQRGQVACCDLRTPKTNPANEDAGRPATDTRNFLRQATQAPQEIVAVKLLRVSGFN